MTLGDAMAPETAAPDAAQLRTIVDRTCPRCGRTTADAVCPMDGAATLSTFEKPMPWTPGMVIDARYCLEQLVGRGGHGAVYAARQVLTGQRVALKLLLPTEDPQHARRFLREADILAKLRSPHTVRILDRGPAGYNSLYLAMSWLDGQSLEQLLAERRGGASVLTQRETIELGIQVLRGLEEAHRVGLVHRDLKPANVMVQQDGDQLSVTLVDFGIAHVRDRLPASGGALSGLERMTAAGTVLGTPTCMSPEQCIGAPLDGRSDLYALGVLLYRCVAGEMPFDDPNGFTVMHNHVHVPPRDLATAAKTPVTLGFVDVVLRALAKAPDQRFADAQAMRLALEGLVRADMQDAPPTRTAHTGEATALAGSMDRGAAPRPRGGAMAAAVAALALAGLMAWWLRPHAAVAGSPRAEAVHRNDPPSNAAQSARAAASQATVSMAPAAPAPARAAAAPEPPPSAPSVTVNAAPDRQDPKPSPARDRHRHGARAVLEDPASTLPPD